MSLVILQGYVPSLIEAPTSSLSKSWFGRRSITKSFVFCENSAELASLIPQTLRANSITAHCKPKQIPRNGILFSLRYCIAEILPSMPLTPNQDLDKDDVGASMRLGTYPCKITKDTITSEIYNDEVIYERHRHRYEVNNKYRDVLEKNGLVFSGLSPDNNLVEMIELTDHPFFVASQFHPEFKSRPWEPAPMFNKFIQSASATVNKTNTTPSKTRVKD